MPRFHFSEEALIAALRAVAKGEVPAQDVFHDRDSLKPFNTDTQAERSVLRAVVMNDGGALIEYLRGAPQSIATVGARLVDHLDMPSLYLLQLSDVPMTYDKVCVHMSWCEMLSQPPISLALNS